MIFSSLFKEVLRVIPIAVDRLVQIDFTESIFSIGKSAASPFPNALIVGIIFIFLFTINVVC
nr:MAG TPA: hypothetical protein [Caudoviricetes sp.]